jgi:hypothetical protein
MTSPAYAYSDSPHLTFSPAGIRKISARKPHGPQVAFGPTTVLPRHDRERLFLGDKQTSDSGDLTSESSQEEKSARHSGSPALRRPSM